MTSKIPQDAKKVFEGVLFDIYQRDQKMFDGSTKTFEICRATDVAKVICVIGDKIMIQKDQQPNNLYKVSLPGGRIENNEDPRLAIKREIQEETGYKFNKIQLIKKYSNQGGVLEKYTYYFVAKNAKYIGGENLDAGGEKIENSLISFDEFVDGIINKQITPHIEFTNHFLMDYYIPGKLEDFKKLLFE